MKKTPFMIAALALSLSIVPSSIQAMEEKKENVGWLKKQFNASLDRFKHCMHGKCTKWEALKVARDLAAAATTVISVIYLGKKVFGQGDGSGIPTKISSDDYLDMEKVKEIYPLGSRVRVQEPLEATVTGTVAGYSFDTIPGYTSKIRNTFLKVQRDKTDTERLVPSIYATRIALPK